MKRAGYRACTGGFLKTIIALCIVVLSVSAAAAQAAPSCDRECLRSTLTHYLYALLKHDTSKLALADNARVTEDGIEKPLAKVGIFKTVTSLRGYRQDILDDALAWAPKSSCRKAERP